MIRAAKDAILKIVADNDSQSFFNKRDQLAYDMSFAVTNTFKS